VPELDRDASEGRSIRTVFLDEMRPAAGRPGRAHRDLEAAVQDGLRRASFVTPTMDTLRVERIWQRKRLAKSRCLDVA